MLLALSVLVASPGAAAEPVDLGAPALDRSALIRAVLDRNPGLDAARASWAAARAVPDQAGSLPDPMLTYRLAPGSIGSAEPPFGQEIALEQRFPFPGKLGAARSAAQAEAEATLEDYRTARLELAAAASHFFDRYYLIERSMAIHDEHIRLVDELLEGASARYASGSGSAQEPLAAEVEGAHLLHRQMELRRELESVRAGINALLHRPMDAEIPPPPERLPLPDPPAEDVSLLEARALEQRPELRERDARVREMNARQDLADRASYPDFALMGSYNNMWAMPEHQWMVGIAVDLPIRRGTRRGGREEARARRTEATDRRLEAEDTIRYEVRQAAAWVHHSHHILELYRSRLLPASRDRVAAARSGYESATISFLDLLEAQKNLRDVELGFEEALTGYSRYRTDLFRALGQFPDGEIQGDQP
jgi:outer membrane protein TolC